MIKLAEYYVSGTKVEAFLILSITLFIIASFVLYLLIITSRNKNIKKERLRVQYSVLIEKLMFSIVFQDTPFSVIQEDKEYRMLSKSFFFRAVLTESIINLHKNYEGIYAKKLEQFYVESGLINDSFRKLRSLKWEIKCKGITELAEMNITEAFNTIIKAATVRNKTLKITAINASIKLGGIKGIVHLTAHPYPIDDWTQVNIINAFKKHDIGDVEGVELLLESQNTTVISLGLKLMKELKLTQKLPFIVQLVAKAPNTLIQNEAQNVVQALTV